MAQISSYDIVLPAADDKLIGSDASNANATRNFQPLGITNMFNVRWYGAVGDGVTDDTAAIQAAITAAQAAQVDDTGAIVFFPPGAYLVSSTLLVSKDGITFLGAGAGGDTSLPSASAGTGTLITPTAAFANNTYVVSVGQQGANRPVSGFRMQGIRIGEVAALVNTVGGIYLKAYRSELADVCVDSMNGDGIHVRGRTSGEGGVWNTYETKFRNVHVSQCTQAGVRLAESTADMHFTNVVLHGNQYGLYVSGGTSCHYLGCHFYSNSTGNLALIGAGSRSKWVGCKFENSGQHNVNIDVTSNGATDLHFVGCNFNSGGYSASNTYDNFIVQRSSGSNTATGVVTGCTFQWITTTENSGTSKPRYHINLSSACASTWRVSGCKYDNNALTGEVNHAATAVRCTFNGVGQNEGDPSSTGDWFGNGEEGVLVRDRSAGGSDGVWLYAEGAWFTLA